MKFASYIDYFGTPAKEIPCITGVGAPTATTEGAVGCLYMDTNSGVIYKCTSASIGNYVWGSMSATLTDQDLQEIVNQVLAAIPSADEVYY